MLHVSKYESLTGCRDPLIFKFLFTPVSLPTTLFTPMRFFSVSKPPHQRRRGAQVHSTNLSALPLEAEDDCSRQQSYAVAAEPHAPIAPMPERLNRVGLGGRCFFGKRGVHRFFRGELPKNGNSTPCKGVTVNRKPQMLSPGAFRFGMI